jgi:anaerobic selenocysteine-containing dehydrogenase
MIDPQAIWLTNIADVHLQLKAGTNVAILNGLLHVLIDEKLINEEFINSRTIGFDDTKKTVMKEFNLDQVEVITCVQAEDIRYAAKLSDCYGSCQRKINHLSAVT